MKSLKLPVAQKGATLIVVLMVVLLISIISVVSIRQSSTDLAISTSAQVKALLFQSNDAALAKLENDDRVNGSASITTSPLAFAISEDQSGNDISFCIEPSRSYLFNMFSVPYNVRSGTTGNGFLKMTTGGVCNPKRPSNFIGARQATMTQINLYNPLKQGNEENHGREVEGTNVEGYEDLGKIFPIVIKSTSVIPAYAANVNPGDISSDFNEDSIAGCMQRAPEGVASATIEGCLQSIGAVFETQQQDYLVKPEFSGGG